MSPESSATVSPEQAYFPRIPPLNLELSNRCNCRCPYCANPVMDRDYGYMQDHIIAKLEEEAVSNGYLIIGVHGTGEPLMRKDLEEVLLRFHEKGIWNAGLTSNGALLSQERVMRLHEVGLAFLYISVDTLDPDLYQRTRSGSLEKVINNIIAAAEAKPELMIQVGLMNHKEQLVNDATRATFSSIFDGLPNISLHVYDCGRMPGAAENWSRYGDHVSDTCIAPGQFLTVLADGKVALCCADQNGQHVLGDVATQTLEEIWYDAENQRTFRNIALGVDTCPDVCVSCVLKRPTNTIDDVEPLLHAPLGEVLGVARDCREVGDFSEALRLFSHAFTRDPGDAGLREELAAMEKSCDRTTDNYHLRYAEGKVS